MVRTYRSFRLSESRSEPFRFCSVIFDDDPETKQRAEAPRDLVCFHPDRVAVTFLCSCDPDRLVRALTCRELQASVDSHSRPLALPDVHGELQPACEGVGAVGEGEAHFVGSSVDRVRRVDQQPVQDVLVGEGGSLSQDAAVFQRLRVKLSPAKFAWKQFVF